MSKDQYIQELNLLFQRHRLKLEVTYSDLLFLDGVVTDACTEGRPISTLLTSMFTPPIHGGEFYHYTRGDVANKILDSGILRLTTVRKRVTEHEISDFLRKFECDYPLGIEPGSNAPRYETSLASKIFYTSFTDVSLSEADEKYFWTQFAAPTGARLKFRLSLKSGCLRRMAYGDQIESCVKLHRDIIDLTHRSLGKVFMWADIGVACALYLPSPYNIEKETRLITRLECGLQLGTEGGYEFLEAIIGDNIAIALRIELLEVQTDQSGENQWGANVIRRTTTS
jgi:hypothetical protein